MLDSKIEAVKLAYGIREIEDWRSITPGQVRAVDGVSWVTLNYIRMLLAGKQITLRGDMTPEYWKQYEAEARVGHSMGKDDVYDVCPFTIIVDSREQAPYSFTGLHAEARDGKRPLKVPIEVRGLATGDYSIVGFEDMVACERKSLSDLYQTASHGRERFERELKRLAVFRYAFVMIEASWARMMSAECYECNGVGWKIADDEPVVLALNGARVSMFGLNSLADIVREFISTIDVKKREKCRACGGTGKLQPERSRMTPKSLNRSITAWQQRYGVHFLWRPTRTTAEKQVFAELKRFWTDVHNPEAERA